jgi:hypothetical protein
LLASLGPAWPADPELILRDAQTGFGLQGVVVVRELEQPVAPLAGVIDGLLAERERVDSRRVDQRIELSIESPLALRAEVAGYRPLHAVLRPDDRVRGRVLMLQPEVPQTVPAPVPGRLRVSGWVHDVETLLPLPGARVRVSGSETQAVSDAGGRFDLEVPAPVVVDYQPEALSITVLADGYPEWRQEGVLAGEDAIVLQVGLGGPSPSAAGHRQLRQDLAWSEPEPVGRRSLPVPRGAGDQPPTSITVGFADAGCSQRCCTGQCSHACSFDLEEYVRRGLPKEWIASWQQDALAAGAVAYRSYGAWHVFNPPSHGAYDLCSSACCQVNEPGTHANTDAAAAATAGLMLLRNDAVFRSEYSAQNNCLAGQMSCVNSDLSCGDGFVGSPALDWPCLADPVGQGRDCFGHGRGMSQWGNHFWTLENAPKNWKQQLDHYYNANGQGAGLRTASISQVLVIDELRVVPASVQPGETFTIELDVRNLAIEPHEAVLFGASVRRPGGAFIDDSDNDRLLVLPAGTSTQSRSFQVPSGAEWGGYELWVSLRIDVDGDGMISGNDLLQHQVMRQDAVVVGGGVFWDRFEMQ